MAERDAAGLNARAPSRRRRRKLFVAAAAALALLAFDLSRPPAAQWTARAELAALARYRATVSPWLGRAGVVCRFETSCSRYAEVVIRRDGALLGTARALWRIARCGPWTPPRSRDPAVAGALVGS